jgi:beta-lactam-binding protein with PASTA domain
VAACALASCGSGPTVEQKKTVRNFLTTTTTTEPTTSSTAVTSSPTTGPQVTVPNVIGLKIAAARAALRGAGLTSVSLNTPCNKGTLASQSVVSSLAIPGKAPDLGVGAVLLSPGNAVSPGTRVGLTWSGCFGDTVTVPSVTGLTPEAAKHALHAVGLTWACYSVGETTTTTIATSQPSTTHPPVTTTTLKLAQTVLIQAPTAGAALHPGATVSLTMHHCPQ